jgi:dolichol-phosphate mannosyltransferase
MKTWLTGLAYRLLHLGATIDLPVEVGDFKLLSRRAMDHLLALPEIDPYLRGLVVWVGFTQVIVPYEREGRHGGRTHFPFFSRNPWKTFVLGLTSFSFFPIYAIGVLAAAGLAAAGGLLLATFWLAAGDGTDARWAALVALFTFFWATALAAIGIVGLYVIRIYKDVRGRPQYIVSSTVGFGEDTPPGPPHHG